MSKLTDMIEELESDLESAIADRDAYEERYDTACGERDTWKDDYERIEGEYVELENKVDELLSICKISTIDELIAALKNK